MTRQAAAALRRELIAAGVRADADSVLLLNLLRQSDETHLRASDVELLIAGAGRRMGSGAILALLESFVAHRVIGRLLLPTGDVVFDTVAECHSHLVDEERGEIVDLQVSPETLAAIVTQMIAQHGRRAGVLLHISKGDAPGVARQRGQGVG